ncbi:hypothetical protein Pan241w_21030 [Gimesia alba]|uniref:Uncharacterized protein n=1 Tax=Gimesia alba TaxID=2527973 RepID=A0A517RDR7_9PLAN|nr:hypothetical protein [Gimesia alba]QDT42022.1 hypothetical protein Pan241w_21030 [Gimesia alba]
MKTVMRKATLPGLCLIVLFSAVHLLPAGPWYSGSNIHYWPGRYSPAIFTPWYGGGYYTGNWGGWGDTRSALIRAQGQAMVDRSRSMVNYEEARAKYLDNQKKLAETYVERQKAQRAYNQERAAMEKEQAAQREAEREKRVAENKKRRESGSSVYFEAGFTQSDVKLSASQLNPATGKISWPESLMGSEYEASREKMQKLFSLRDSTGATSDISQQIYAEAQKMKNQLRGQIRDMLPNDYLAARRFIEGLANMGKTA